METVPRSQLCPQQGKNGTLFMKKNRYCKSIIKYLLNLLSCSDSQQKTSTEDAFTDVFENIQMQLEVIGGLREKPWSMQRKLQILR